jgi:hypothetical protein
VQRFIDVNVTDERLRRERETGDGFIEELHLAMAAEGWLEREVRRAGDGGFSPVEQGEALFERPHLAIELFGMRQN